MANAVKPYRARYVVFHEELVHARIHMLNIIHAYEAILVEDARNKYTKRAAVGNDGYGLAGMSTNNFFIPAQASLLNFEDVLPALRPEREVASGPGVMGFVEQDRKSTRLNSSHVAISYA